MDFIIHFLLDFLYARVKKCLFFCSVVLPTAAAKPGPLVKKFSLVIVLVDISLAMDG